MKTKDHISKGSNRQNPPESQLSLPTVEEQGILIESITHIKAGEKEELALRLNSNYEKVWRKLS